MDSSNRDARMQRKSIFDFWHSTPAKDRLNEVINFVKVQFGVLVQNEEQDEKLKAFLKKECEKIRVKWVRKQRRLDLFLKEHEDWLNEDLNFNMLVAPEDLSQPSTSGGFGTILAAITSGYEINTEKFQEFCQETRVIYVNLYAWYNMPATVHKILVHGTSIIKNCIIPIGQMSEEASEAKNKEIRKARLGHTMKTARYRTNYDLMKHLLISSDPYITLLRKLPRKSTLRHDKDVLTLLKD